MDVEAHALVANRVEDVDPGNVIQGSTVETCAGCDRDVWVSPASAEVEVDLILCVQCAIDAIGVADSATVNPPRLTQRMEIDAHRRRN